MRCNDCGKSEYKQSKVLKSVCVDCWNLRDKCTDLIGKPGFDWPAFREVQRRMNSGQYDGAAAMAEFLGLDQPVI